MMRESENTYSYLSQLDLEFLMQQWLEGPIHKYVGSFDADDFGSPAKFNKAECLVHLAESILTQFRPTITDVAPEPRRVCEFETNRSANCFNLICTKSEIPEVEKELHCKFRSTVD